LFPIRKNLLGGARGAGAPAREPAGRRRFYAGVKSGHERDVLQLLDLQKGKMS